MFTHCPHERPHFRTDITYLVSLRCAAKRHPYIVHKYPHVMVKMCSDRYISQWLLRKVRECVMLQHENFRDIRVDFSFNIITYAKPIIHPCNHHCNEEGNTLVA